MVIKRKRAISTSSNGLPPGARLFLAPTNTGPLASLWGWVGTEVKDPEDITLEHRLATCGFSKRNNNAPCTSKHSRRTPKSPQSTASIRATSPVNGELEDDIIVISDDEDRSCSKKSCKSNPYCLNFLGQDPWFDEAKARTLFMDSAKLGFDPDDDSREEGLPVGLKNLGATCYANASLQVWYRNLAFREGVYLCKPPDETAEDKYQDSPIFQLQATFAALQAGNKRVFNPAKLVESLQLRTFEQQDAQEFSKLFMSHLDSEFKKQTLPSLKSLVTDQFQGTLLYGTRCHSCGHRSERSSDFLEIEISFTANSKLEDRISASLAPESLSEDNKYFCSKCEQLQDATRHTELQDLPPVLQFSLMRFVYDLTSMERKKSKQSLTFPTVLDMTPFVKNRESDDASTGKGETYIYELAGVLLHKGASAYHGHYEAQVKDPETNSWFLFNDEAVTKIKSLGSKTPETVIVVDDDDVEKVDSSQIKKSRANARKRRRVADSDDESPRQVSQSNTVSSKDAYMLIYSKKQVSPDESSVRTPQPPSKAMEVVEDMNKSHASLCSEFLVRKETFEEQFQDIRNRMMTILESWNTSPTSESVVVNQQALTNWVKAAGTEGYLKLLEQHSQSCEDGESAEPSAVSLSVSDIVCEHIKLNPAKSQDMKCISQAAYDSIVEHTGCRFTSVLHPHDVCEQCISTLFREKLYEHEHPLLAKQFDEFARVDEGESGYWISKMWCRDWRLLRPKMHCEFQDDPAPDSSEFRGHVNCEHGNIGLNATSRRRISERAMLLLKKLFPAWDPPSTAAEVCVICEAAVHTSKEDKKEIRRRVEDEKARLRFILEPSLDSWRRGSQGTLWAAVPSQFIKQWKRWLNDPCQAVRPESIDNSSFFCEHGHLIFDPNYPADLDSVVVIEKKDWDVLTDLYQGGPLISFTKEVVGANDIKYHHEVPICSECRMKSKIEWETADIVIRWCSSKELSESKSGSANMKEPLIPHSQSNGTRQSKRLRQIREHGEKRRLTVSKSTTIKDIKIMVQKEFSIPTLCQRLFHGGQELDDNSATVEELKILANDVLDLKEVQEVYNVDSDIEDAPPTKKRREGPAFGGTLLGSSNAWSSSPERTTPGPQPQPQPQVSNEKACSSCTYVNATDVAACEMCESPFV